jgi:hypothetical protein
MRHSPAQTGTVPPDQDGCRVSHRLEGDRVDNLEHGSPRLLNRIHAEHHPCGSSVVSPSSISRPCPHHALLITSHNVQPIISPRIYLSSPSSPLINPKLTMTPLALSSLALRASECSVAVFWRKWDLICLARAICGGAKRGQRWNVSLVLGWCLGLGRRHGI